MKSTRMPDTFTVAVAQIYPRLADQEYNLELHCSQIKEAVKLGADCIVFPELSLSGYSLKDLTADKALDPHHSPLFKEICSLSNDIHVVFGFVEQEDYVYYNSAAWCHDGGIVHIHRKVYLPTYGMFDEERYFSPGHCIRAFDTPLGRFAILICEDYWHPSSVYLAAQDGALFHVYMANAPVRGLTLPDEITSVSIAENMANISSQLYGVYSIYANRTGIEDGITFGGGSRVISPTGGIVARAGREEPELLLAEIETAQIRRARTFFPLLGDEKLDMVHRELTRIRNREFHLEVKDGD